MSADFDKIEKIAMRDIAQLQRAEKSYGDSWRKRGGVGAFISLKPVIGMCLAPYLMICRLQVY